MGKDGQRPSRGVVWLTAVRPFAYTASLLAVLLGLAVAHYSGAAVRWGLFALTLVGVVSFHTAANLLNDCFDHRRGLDTEVLPTSGAIVRGWLTEREVLRAAVLFLCIGVACGLALTRECGLVVLGLGLAGSLIVLTYTGAGFCFKYNGLGDIAIFVAFGVLPVFGAYWVQTQAFSWQPVLWSLPLVSLTVGILHANNWRDIAADRQLECRTIAGFLGEHGSQTYYRALILTPFALVGFYVLARITGIAPISAPMTTLAVFLAFPAALPLLRAGRARADVFFALDAKTAQLQLQVGVLLSVALLVARHLPGAR